MFVAIASFAYTDDINKDKSATQPPAATPAPAPEPKTAEEVFDRYVRAIGGRDAIEKVKTRVTKSVMELPTFSITGKGESFNKAPNKLYSILVLDAGTLERGFDGKTGWSKDPFGGGLRDLGGLELSGLKQEAELQLPIKLKELFPKAKLKGKEKVENTDVYVVDLPVGDKAEQAYFNAMNGLLIRWNKEIQSQEGPVAAEQRFEDYREVDGVKIPFVVSMTTPQFSFTNKVSEVKHNIEIPESKFTKPSE
jgi:zinc protease